MTTPDVSEKPSAPIASTPRTGSASLWAVSFETKEGMFHPVRYGKAGGMKYSREEIAGAAELYLKKESRWLKCVDEIRPLDETLNVEASEPGTMTHDNPKPEAANPRRNPGSLR